MNGYRKWGSSALGAVIAAALALGAFLLLAPIGSAQAAPTPEFTLVYTGLQQGVPQTEVGSFTLERDADLVLFEWLDRAGVLAPPRVALDVEVCDSAGNCFDPTAITGPVPFAAGTGTLAITAELMTPAENGETGSITGRMSFTAPDDALAATGSEWAPWISAGLATVAVGELVLALIRGRRGPDQVASHSSR